jgi:hypothetical protein
VGEISAQSSAMSALNKSGASLPTGFPTMSQTEPPHCTGTTAVKIAASPSRRFFVSNS